jgi:hypothetical protein
MEGRLRTSGREVVRFGAKLVVRIDMCNELKLKQRLPKPPL